MKSFTRPSLDFAKYCYSLLSYFVGTAVYINVWCTLLQHHEALAQFLALLIFEFHCRVEDQRNDQHAAQYVHLDAYTQEVAVAERRGEPQRLTHTVHCKSGFLVVGEQDPE